MSLLHQTTPIPILDVSHPISKKIAKSGSARMGASVNSCLRATKTFSYFSSSYLNQTYLLIISFRSAAKLLKFLTYILSKLVRLWKLLTSLKFLGLSYSWITFTFSWSTWTPLALTIKSNNVICLVQIVHFLRSTYNFYF